jgi:tetratricopeptide (TPR) repeat protein
MDPAAENGGDIAIEGKTLGHAPKKVQDPFNKGLGAMDRANLDYAIDLFTSCLDMEPLLFDVRKFLRAAEIRKSKEGKGGAVKHALATAKGAPLMARLSVAIKQGKGMEAISLGEKLLRIDPLNTKFILLFCDACESASLPQLAVQTLTIARDQHPDNLAVITRLGKAYLKANQPREARTCFETVVAARPNDGEALKALKNTMALESMSEGWEQAAAGEGDYRDLLKDADEAAVLETEAKAVRTASDSEALIAETIAKIEREPENVNYYRALANLYASEKRFDEAIDVLTKAQELRVSADPEIDALLSSMQINKFDAEVSRLSAAGDEAAADQMREQRDEFYFTDIQQRVHKYPNDLNLRHELGIAFFQYEMFTDAAQQFQLAQKSPRWRIKSLYHLGLCFKAKQQYDLATEQLKQAASELPSMDKVKKDIIYELGLVQEATGSPDAAVEYYKQIYQVDIGYKDVAEKVERGYGQ